MKTLFLNQKKKKKKKKKKPFQVSDIWQNRQI